MTKKIRLHDYQSDIVLRLCKAWQKHRSVMVQMPTGTGKTHVLAAVVKDFLARNNGRVWIIAHRRELVEQIEETTERYGISRKDKNVRVMSIQWLTKHWGDMDECPSMVVIDEAHHAQARTYRMLWERWPQARFLGLTATPCRMNKSGFTDLFDTLICSWSIAEFIEKGRLSVFDYISIRRDSEEQRLIDTLEKRGADGDYYIKEMNHTLNRLPNIEKLYESVREFASNRKGIVYAISIDHARNIAEYYSKKGLKAVAIDSKTPMAERKQHVEDFKRGRNKVLVNVDVFSEGFDCPDVEFVQMARPTLSLSKYLQQVGRGLRKAKDKKTCVLIDNVGLYRVFGLPTATWDWEAMFHGEATGKRTHTCRQQGKSYPTCPTMTLTGDVPQNNGMEVIMSHDMLLSAIVEQRNVQPVPSQKKSPELKAWQDEKSGLWGLQYGSKRTTSPIFDTVFDIQHDLAAVRFKNKNCGLVNAEGKTVWENGHYLSMRFSKNFFLTAQTTDKKFHFVDLHGLRVYNERPEVKRFGEVEMLKVGGIYYSRTKKLYVNNQNLNSDGIYDRKFYVAIFDYKMPASYCIQNSCANGYRWGYACILKGDYESFYYIYRWLADGSIIVSDDTGKYYHVTDNKGKEYIGCCDSVESGNCCLDALERISKQAQEVQRNIETEKAKKRLRNCFDFIR